MKYTLLQIAAWLICATVVVIAITRQGSVADARTNIIRIDGTSAATVDVPKAAAAGDSVIKQALPAEADTDLVADVETADTTGVAPEAIKLNDLGVAQLSQGHLDSAIALFRESLGRDSVYARGHYNLGIAYHRAGRVKEAIREYGLAIAIRPNYFRALYSLGRQYYDIGRYDEARDWLTKATGVKRNEEAAAAFYKLGLAYKHLGDQPRADAAYRSAIRLRPGHIEARYALALSRMDDGKYEEAAQELTRVSALGLKRKQLYSNLGICYSRTGKPDLAITAYQQGLALEPNDPKGWFNLAISFNKLGRRDEAIDAYRKAMLLDTAYYEAHFNLALLYADKSDTAGAITEYQQAIRQRPSYSKAQYNLALIFLERDMYDSAIVHLQEVASLDPENLRALFNLGLANSRAEHLPQAAEAYHRLLDQDPVNLKALNNLGTVYSRLRENDSALVFYNRLVGLTHSAEAYYNRADARKELDSIDPARQDYLKAIELKPDYAKAYHNLAILEEKLKNLDRAVELLKKAIQYDTDNWKSHWKLGQVYLAMGRTAEAKAEYALAAATNPSSEKFKKEYDNLLLNR